MISLPLNKTTADIPSFLNDKLPNELSNLNIVIVAFFITMLAVKASIDSYYSVINSKHCFVKTVHLLIAGSCLGSGIWCMHFYAMLAMKLPISYDFDLAITSYTLFAIILSSIVSLHLLSLNKFAFRLVSPFVLSLGIIVMHYWGMEAILFRARIIYQYDYFIASVITALLASFTFCFSLCVYYAKKGKRSKITAIFICMTVATSVFITHELGMLSAVFIPDNNLKNVQKEVYPPIYYGLFMASSLIIFFSLVAIFTQKQLISNNRQITKAKVLLKELRRSRAELKSLAYYDPLTSLQNKRSLFHSIDYCIKNADKTDSSFIVLFLDIDNFKIINDTLGHSVGDELLSIIAGRLKSFAVLESDISRFGGDEFVLIIHDPISTLSDTIEKILFSIKQPIILCGCSYRTSTSIGACIYPQDGSNVEELLLSADLALFRAKTQGKNQFSFFDKSLKEELEHKVFLKENLEKAIDEGNVQLYYQPIIDAKMGRIVKLEALCRWNLNGSFVSPDTFINIAEQYNLMNKLGRYIIELAIKDSSVIYENFNQNIRMAINLSPSQLTDENLVVFISSILTKYNLPGELISLEITESSIARNMEHAIYQLNELKKLGVNVSIDDFGTGYSSLSHLQKLPIDTLKIDRSFITPLPDSPDTCIIVETILVLAKKLKLEVVIEGVEHEKQLNFFHQYNELLIQGYYFYKPMPFNEVIVKTNIFKSNPFIDKLKPSLTLS